MKYVSLFSGIEAATVAWEPLGWEPVCFAEFDEFPSAVLAERYPEVPNVGDVTKMNWKKYRGKVADECPDGPRYKAIGNSMAVPVMRFIGERIAMAEAGEIS